MLLTKWIRHARANESGSALVAVLGVTVLALILTTLIASSTVSAYGFSSATRAAVQSHAAADAGVAAARAGLYVPGNCAARPVAGTYTSTGALIYSATVQYDAGSGWYPGCPTSLASRVRIVSTGTAKSSGVVGATSGNTRKVEAIFNYLTPGPKPSGAGITLYGGGQVEANSSLDLSESAGLIVQNGNVVCDKNNAVINGDVTVNGNLNFTNSCTINGDTTVSGSATLGSGKIVGNLTAASVSPNPPPISQVTGTYTQTAVAPVVPPWVDVSYTPSDWIDSSGTPFQLKTAPTDISCTLPNGTLGATGVGRSVIINMLGCTGGPSVSNNTTVSLTSDVVIFAQQFNFGSVNSLTFNSADTSVHRIWFITPDYVANHQPTCNRSAAAPNTQGDFVVKNSLTASDVFATTNRVQAMLYTPCAFVGKNGFTWNGQIYAGAYSYVQNNPTFTYAPIGIAGYDLKTGDSIPSVLTPQPGAQISNRDLLGG
ncbi:MAG: hypothetical protein JWM49_1845 [Microbacteriaceae bacterium]|nr:hypothetical protein [Microbacteriaceae bacterium]